MMPAAHSAAMIAAAAIAPTSAAIACGAMAPRKFQRADFCDAAPSAPADERAASGLTSWAVKSMVGGRRRDGLSGSLVMHPPRAIDESRGEVGLATTA